MEFPPGGQLTDLGHQPAAVGRWSGVVGQWQLGCLMSMAVVGQSRLAKSHRRRTEGISPSPSSEYWSQLLKLDEEVPHELLVPLMRWGCKSFRAGSLE